MSGFLQCPKRRAAAPGKRQTAGCRASFRQRKISYKLTFKIPDALIQEKDSVIQNLIQNGHKEETEMAELQTKVAQIESSKPALEALLKRVLELESKL